MVGAGMVGSVMAVTGTPSPLRLRVVAVVGVDGTVMLPLYTAAFCGVNVMVMATPVPFAST